MSEPTTQAGKRLLDSPELWGHISGEDILAIEAEARADLAARIEARVTLLADRQLAEDAERALHCIWPTIHLRVLNAIREEAER